MAFRGTCSSRLGGSRVVGIEAACRISSKRNCVGGSGAFCTDGEAFTRLLGGAHRTVEPNSGAMGEFVGRLMLILAFVGGIIGLGAALSPSGTSMDDAAIGKSAATRVTSVSTTKEKGAQKSDKRRAKTSKTSRHAPRERLVAADMAIARSAVLHSSDLAPSWKRARLSPDNENGCSENDPDLSRFTVTGKARSAFRGGQSLMVSRVKLFANAGQAALYFEAISNRTILRCIRDGIKRALRRANLRPQVMYARFQEEPPIGARTAHYVIGYVITTDKGSYEYPVDVLTFQMGRAIGALSFSFVPSDDGRRPCACELDEARLVASRLNDT
jgi:hypothetical protein